MADTPPEPPERIAHLVATENEGLDNEFGERRGAGGEVHVQSHAREGGKVEVSDYWRAAPGQGSGSERPPEPPRARNLLDDAENAEDTQAGTDDDLPPGESPVDNPRIRGRDGFGRGDYGVSRGKDKDGNQKFHKGVDLVTEPGETVRSPVAGTVLPQFDPYRSDPKRQGNLSAVQIKTDDGHIVEILYVDPQSSGLKPGDKIEIVTPIGSAQDLAPVYPPTKEGGIMTNHIDVRIKKGGVYKDPSPLIFGRRR